MAANSAKKIYWFQFFARSRHNIYTSQSFASNRENLSLNATPYELEIQIRAGARKSRGEIDFVRPESEKMGLIGLKISSMLIYHASTMI